MNKHFYNSLFYSNFGGFFWTNIFRAMNNNPFIIIIIVIVEVLIIILYFNTTNVKE